jgi:hypothetical protein
MYSGSCQWAFLYPQEVWYYAAKRPTVDSGNVQDVDENS